LPFICFFPMSYSVLRRYTPPTCTLEILANSSPLARWAGQPVLKNLRFQLTLDDPTLPKENWIRLWGDRDQLEALCDAVALYVQRFLAQSSSRLSGVLSPPTHDAIAIALVEPATDLTTFKAEPNAAGVTVRSQRGLSHELSLGTLANQESGASTTLSTLQLLDLANALDEYITDVVALPNLTRSPWIRTPLAWAQIAAVAVLVVGVSASVVKLNASKSSAPTASSSDQKLAAQLPASVESQQSPSVSTKILPPPPPPAALVPLKPGLPIVQVPQQAAINSSAGKTMSGATSPSRSVVVPGAPTVHDRQADTRSHLPASRIDPELTVAPNSNQPMASTMSRSLPKSSAAAAEQSGTAFDTIPQIAEARSYFQKRWKPPQGLTQVLEYSLILAPGGTVQRMIPLGQAAGDYIDRTGMPLVGEPFVSPVQGGRSARIRLVLSPDGTVQTFLEALN
jgi:hypothetical protein